jgi:hypothetical protein
MSKGKRLVSLVPVWALLLSIVSLGTSNVSAATNQFRGVNWADSRDNFQSGVINQRLGTARASPAAQGFRLQVLWSRAPIRLSFAGSRLTPMHSSLQPAAS